MVERLVVPIKKPIKPQPVLIRKKIKISPEAREKALRKPVLISEKIRISKKAKERALPKKYTPAQMVALSTLKRIRTIKDYSRMKSRIDSSKTYLVPVSYFIPGGHGHRHVTGEELKKILDKERVDYLKQEIAVSRQMRKLPKDTKVTVSDKGIDVKLTKKGKAELLIEWQRGFHKKIPEPLRTAYKFSAGALFGGVSPEFWHKTLTGGVEGGREVVAGWEYATYQTFADKDIKGFVSNIVSSPLYSNILLPFLGGAVIGKSISLVGRVSSAVTRISSTTGKIISTAGKYGKYGVVTALVGLEGKRVYTEFLKSPEKGAFALIETGMRFGFAYKGIKVGMTPKSPKSINILKPMYKDYTADLRIAQRFTTAAGKTYGKLPSYLGRSAYGSNKYLSTVEQMQGTVLRSGGRGADPLGASAWEYYRSINLEPVVVSKVLSSTRFYMTKAGVIKPTYNIFKKPPQLATGKLPKEFLTPQVTIKISGISKGLKNIDFPVVGKGDWLAISRGAKPIDTSPKGIFKSYGKDVGYRYVTVKKLSDIKLSFGKYQAYGKDVGYRYVTVNRLPDIPLKFAKVLKFPKLKPVTIIKSTTTSYTGIGTVSRIASPTIFKPLKIKKIREKTSLELLEFLEEGTDYISPKVSNQFKKSLVKVSSLTIPKFDVMSTQALDQIQIPKSEMKPKQITIPAILPISGVGSMLDMKQLEKELSVQKFKFPQLTIGRTRPDVILQMPFEPDIPPLDIIKPPKPLSLFTEKERVRREKIGFGIKPLDLKYHIREHKVIKLEDLLRF